MPDFTLKTAQVSATPGQTIWAQAHAFSDAFFIVVLEKNQESEANLPASGKQFLLRFEQIYQEIVADQAKKNLDTLRLLVQKASEGIDDIKIVSLVVGLLIHPTAALYIGAVEGEVRLKRKGTLKRILKGGKIAAFASGFLEDADLLLLLSSAAPGEASAHMDEEVFGGDEPDEIGEALSAFIHKSKGQEKQVAFIAKMKRSLSMSFAADNQQEEPVKEERGRRKPLIVFGKLMRPLIQEKTRRVVITVFILLVVLFTSSLFLGIRKKGQEAVAARFTQVYTQATQRYEEGLALSDLNPQLAQKTFAEVKETVEKELPAFEEKSKEKEELSALAQKIDEGLRVALRIRNISDAPLFFDLTLIKNGASGITMSLFEGKMLILDSKNQAVYTLTVSSKKSDLVAGALSGVRKEAIGIDSAFFLDDEGIEKVTLKVNKRALAVKKDDSWGEIESMVSFGGNLYLLDKRNGSIYKYQGIESGFGERRNYLASDVKPDFSGGVAMAIDGSVWVLFSDGRVSKFTQGAPQAFSIAGIDSPLLDPASLFTDDISEYLYILDRGNMRIVVANKDGTYTSQYQWEGIKDVTDIVVSEEDKKILLLSGSKIFSIDLKL